LVVASDKHALADTDTSVLFCVGAVETDVANEVKRLGAPRWRPVS
jgi:hypothetical protein